MQKDFLQSEEWRKFQESVGRKTFLISNPHPSPLPQAGEGDILFHASIIEHNLPIVGKYFYIPRGPEKFSNKILEVAKKEKAGWIRIDPASEEILRIIKNGVRADLASAQEGQTQGLSLRKYKIAKAPHDMQPKEIFVVDITKNEEQLLAEMKSKTRYNVKLAEKKEIKIKKQISGEYVEDFLRLNKIMAKRQGIVTHDDEYYRKMLEVIPENILKLYVAEYEDKIVAANLVIFYGQTCIYLHGALDDSYKNLMVPYLLQWRQIQDAKKAGCKKYDFGGVKTNKETNSWVGITRFKTGFSPQTKPIEFLGSYDIVINPIKYEIYRIMQKIKSCIKSY